MTEEEQAEPAFTTEEQKQNRDELIPRIKAVLEILELQKRRKFILISCVVSGFFLIFGGLLHAWFPILVGLILFSGGLFFMKKETDYANYLKDKYGVE